MVKAKTTAKIARIVLAEHFGREPDIWDVLRAADRLAREMGGERHYLEKPTSLGKTTSLATHLASGASLNVAIQRTGCSRQWAYKLLHRRWSMSW